MSDDLMLNNSRMYRLLRNYAEKFEEETGHSLQIAGDLTDGVAEMVEERLEKVFMRAARDAVKSDESRITQDIFSSWWQ